MWRGGGCSAALRGLLSAARMMMRVMAALRLLREAEELFDREVCRHCH